MSRRLGEEVLDLYDENYNISSLNMSKYHPLHMGAKLRIVS